MRRAMFALTALAVCTLAAATPNRMATEAYVTNALTAYVTRKEILPWQGHPGYAQNAMQALHADDAASAAFAQSVLWSCIKDPPDLALKSFVLQAVAAATNDPTIVRGSQPGSYGKWEADVFASWAKGIFWDDVHGTPTTLSGYGITDAATAKQVKSLETAINSEAGTREEGYNELSYNMGLLDAKVAAKADASALAAKQDRPAATTAATSLSYRADGGAVSVSVADGGTLAATLDGWTDGQSQTALISLASGASVDGGISLVGYGSWPTVRFLASCVRVGSRVYVTPITYVAED